MLHITDAEWTRLYKELVLAARRLTFTKSRAKEWTARDRGQEAVQRACERFLRRQPPWLATLDDARAYLIGAVRSELGHARREGVRRGEAESKAAIEQGTLEPQLSPSAQDAKAAQAIASAAQERAERVVALTREELGNDTIALGTMDCIADDKDAPAEQADILGCSVEEIYLARSRRKRAMARAIARYEAEMQARKGTTP